MKPWKEANAAEQEAMVEAAMKAAGRNVTRAALILGISRRHLTRFRSETRRLTETSRLSETPETNETRQTREPSRGINMVSPAHGGETATERKHLSYADSEPTFVRVSTAVTATAQREEKRIAIDLPKSDDNWLEEEALRQKRATNGSRPSKGKVVEAAIEHFRRWIEAERAAGRTGYEEPADEKGGTE